MRVRVWVRVWVCVSVWMCEAVKGEQRSLSVHCDVKATYISARSVGHFGCSIFFIFLQ